MLFEMSFNECVVDINQSSSEEIIGCKMKFEKKFICSSCNFEVENEEELFSHCNKHGSYPSENQITQEYWNSEFYDVEQLDSLIEDETERRLSTDDSSMQIEDGNLLSPIPEIQQINSPMQCSNNVIYIKSSSQPKLKKVRKETPLIKSTVFVCPICKKIFFSINDCDDHFAIDHRKKKHQRQRLNYVVTQRSVEKLFTQAELSKLMKKSSKSLGHTKLRSKSTKGYSPKTSSSDIEIIFQEEHKEQLTSHLKEENNSKPSGEELYVVEEILDKRINDGEEEYHVKWLGYPIEDSTWEPTESFNSLEAVKEYEQSIIVKQNEASIPNTKSDDCNSNEFENNSSQDHLNETTVEIVSESSGLTSEKNISDRLNVSEQENHLNETTVEIVSESSGLSSEKNIFDRLNVSEQEEEQQQCPELIFIGDSTAKHAVPRNLESNSVKISVIFEEGASMERIAILVDNCIDSLCTEKANHRILIIVFGGHSELSVKFNQATDSKKFLHHLKTIYNKAVNSSLPQLATIFTFPCPIDYKRYHLYGKDPESIEKVPVSYKLRNELDTQLLQKSKAMALQIKCIEDICRLYWPVNSYWRYLPLGKINYEMKTSFHNLLVADISNLDYYEFFGQQYLEDGLHLSHLGASSFWIALCKLLKKYVDIVALTSTYEKYSEQCKITYKTDDSLVTFGCEKPKISVPLHFSSNSVVLMPANNNVTEYCAPMIKSTQSSQEQEHQQFPIETIADSVTSEFESVYSGVNDKKVARRIVLSKNSVNDIPLTPKNKNISKQYMRLVESNEPNQYRKLKNNSYCENSKYPNPFETIADSVNSESECGIPSDNVRNGVARTSDKEVTHTSENIDAFKQVLNKVEDNLPKRQYRQHIKSRSTPPEYHPSKDSAAVTMNPSYISSYIDANTAIFQNEVSEVQGRRTFNKKSEIFERVFNQTFEKIRPIFKDIFMEELRKEGILF